MYSITTPSPVGPQSGATTRVNTRAWPPDARTLFSQIAGALLQCAFNPIVLLPQRDNLITSACQQRSTRRMWCAPLTHRATPPSRRLEARVCG
mmetsp:Transcript_25856/g.45425  ORF Transcript_25856/g.45425 Transcript_25856/m.45425 type:complete len:93 (+) Transcript_25856:248-526(+)